MTLHFCWGWAKPYLSEGLQLKRHTQHFSSIQVLLIFVEFFLAKILSVLCSLIRLEFSQPYAHPLAAAAASLGWLIDQNRRGENVTGSSGLQTVHENYSQFAFSHIKHVHKLALRILLSFDGGTNRGQSFYCCEITREFLRNFNLQAVLFAWVAIFLP